MNIIKKAFGIIFILLFIFILLVGLTGAGKNEINLARLLLFCTVTLLLPGSLLIYFGFRSHKNNKLSTKVTSVNSPATVAAEMLEQTTGHPVRGWQIKVAANQKVGVTSIIQQNQADIADTIIEMNKKITDEGYGNFNLVVAPGHEITAEFITKELVKRGVEPANICFNSLNQMHTQLMTYLSDRSLKEKLLKDTQSGTLLDVLTSVDIESSLASLTAIGQVALLLNIMKIKIKVGELRYAVLDASQLGSDWNLGEMNAPDTVEKLRGSDKSKKIQTILWLVNFDYMTKQEVRVGAALIDPFGDRRFHSSVYDKILIQVTSVASTRRNSILQNIADKNGAWSIKLLMENIPQVELLNE